MAAKRAPTRPKRALLAVAKQLQAHRKKSRGNAPAHLLTVQQQMEAIAAGNYAGVLAQAHPKIELEIHAPPGFPFICRARGVKKVQEAIEHNFSSIEEQRPVVTNVLSQGDVLVLFGTERGRVRDTGLNYHVEFVHRFTFEGQQLRNVRIIVAQTRR